ncbi:MAG: coproporphyrinogen dehydrogenase HemZ [Oscillospiraceae bacterium]|nr:coproporphyrinogen dehydrogenase HemZ [Oscillospiraceae bacterium]
MTIILNNNTFKYETEAVVKLFIPATRFTFAYDITDADSDICMTRVKNGRKFVYLFAYVRIGTQTARRSVKLTISKKSDSECEYQLCRLLFECLVKLTGITPGWGLLTGIRPVKKVNRMLNDGMSKAEIFSALSDRYMISRKKLDTAYLTAMTQLPVIADYDKKTISLYISIPFCPTRCSYCSFVSHSMQSAQKLIPQYIDKLCDELEILGQIVDSYGLKIDTVYYGGGTPTAITADQLYTLMKKTRECFDISQIREYNVEAGRADTITVDKLSVIKEMGATRISINPQTLNDDVLRVIGRHHTSDQTINAFRLARSMGFDNINMDLIAGLPTESFESFKSTVDTVTQLDPDGITVHTLTLKRSAQLYSEGHDSIKSPASQMVDYSFEKLTSNGYFPYYLYRQKNTVDNLENIGYARKGKESLYNIYIMDETQTILGAGCAASTKLVGPDGSISRVHNYKFPYEYINRFDELMQKKKEITDFFKTGE